MAGGGAIGRESGVGEAAGCTGMGEGPEEAAGSEAGTEDTAGDPRWRQAGVGRSSTWDGASGVTTQRAKGEG